MIVAIHGKKSAGKDTLTKLIQYHTCKDDSWFKDSIVTSLVEWNGDFDNLGEWKNKKFASPIKEIVSLITGISLKDLEKEEVKSQELPDWKVWKLDWSGFKEDGEALFASEEEASDYSNYLYEEVGIYNVNTTEFIPTVRYFLQYIGTDLFRSKVHPDVWVKSLFSQYKSSYENNYWYRDKSIYEVSEEDERKYPPEFPKWIISDLRFKNELKAVKDRNGIVVKVTRPETDKQAGNHPSETELDSYKQWDWVFDNSKDLEHLNEQVKQFVKFYKL